MLLLRQRHAFMLLPLRFARLIFTPFHDMPIFIRAAVADIFSLLMLHC